jgi:hypothetical protein
MTHALAAGATSILETTEQSWGDRTCGFVDPFDNRWWVATHLRGFSSTDHHATIKNLDTGAGSEVGRPTVGNAPETEAGHTGP